MNKPHSTRPLTSDHWSDYWTGGRLTSLPDDFEGRIAVQLPKKPYIGMAFF